MKTNKTWSSFWLLSLIWGSSYLFIRIGVEQMPPFQLVFIRTAIAAVGLNAVVFLRGEQLPKDRRSIFDLVFLGVVNTVIPFTLITWGETQIESSLASILQGTAALFTLLIAHFAFADERITFRKLLGLVIGFLGVVVLAGRGAGEAVTSVKSTLYLLGQLAIVGSSLCYAIGGTYSRKTMQHRLEPIVVAAGAMTVAAITTGFLTFLAPSFGGVAPIDIRQLEPGVLGAVLTLGIVNTFMAYLIFYALIAQVGAARASMVSYVIPVVGLVLGVVFLGEALDHRLVLGAMMVVGSIAIVNLNLKGLFRATITRWKRRLS